MSLVHPVARARGMGSAKSGVHHWWVQRLTAIALVPLTLWIIWAMVTLAGTGHAEVMAWMGSPLNASLLIAFVIAMLHHAQLGLQVIVEDYVHSAGTEFTLHVIIKLLALLGMFVGTVSILRVAFAA